MPSEYEGGIGKDGVEAIKTFVRNGGILVTLSEACRLAFQELGVPASDAVQGLERTKFFLPSSLVRIQVNPESPLGYGMPTSAAAMFANSVVMDTWLPGAEDTGRQVVASYPVDDILLSGWLIGGERMAGKVAVLDVKQGKGRIALIGFRPQYRGQSHGTYKFLLNALLYPQRTPPAVSSENGVLRR
jgi:ribosomal protein S18 acetylase RimI-like enzyme